MIAPTEKKLRQGCDIPFHKAGITQNTSRMESTCNDAYCWWKEGSKSDGAGNYMLVHTNMVEKFEDSTVKRFTKGSKTRKVIKLPHVVKDYSLKINAVD